MSVEYVEFLVEELSMEVFLRGLLPRLLGDVPFEIHPFQCKDELLARLPERLQGYAAWRPEGHRIIVVVDRDDDDCRELKRRLEQAAQEAKLVTRSRSRDRFDIINRIAVEELEAWYFGDWEAVCAAYPRVSPAAVRKAPFRDPDGIAGGTWEAFERELQKAGYFKAGLRKLEVARSIIPHLDPARNTSRSFQVLREAILELAGSC